MLTESHIGAAETVIVPGVLKSPRHLGCGCPATAQTVAPSLDPPPIALVLKPASLQVANISATRLYLHYTRNHSLSSLSILLLTDLQNPTSIPSPCFPQVSVGLRINTMATRTLEAGLQRMSIQDENATGESSRLYSKTSKVSTSLYDPNSFKSC